MTKMRIFTLHNFAFILTSLLFLPKVATQESNTTVTFQATLKIATDGEYPNNNMIGFKSKLDGYFTHQTVLITENTSGKFDFIILPGNAISDTLIVNDINLEEFMPSIPGYVNEDEYLRFIALLNQEWNRIQVKFSSKRFAVNGSGTEKNIVTRVDIANNCLAKGLWEILAFTSESGNELLYFQCWFDFPVALYEQLFQRRNGVTIAAYDDMLKNYTHRPGEIVNLNTLRKVKSEKQLPFKSLNHEYYPLKGERETKLKNIVTPTVVTSINDLLNDNTTFATFAPPGNYTRADPRKTQLSRFRHLEKAILLQTTSNNKAATTTNELQFLFSDIEGVKQMRFVIGGLQLDNLPLLNPNTMHKGWQRPMGIGNHSFYNAYDDLVRESSAQNPYFAFLIDETGKWLDSHEIGIDGVLLYRDETAPSQVHVLILSFERHAFIGHTVLNIPAGKAIQALIPTTANEGKDKKLVFIGDMRSRLIEDDWNVITQDGKHLDPRTRMRLRMRFGFNYQYSKTLSFGARIRTGSSNEQQSPHITLGANESANIPIGLDRAFIRYVNKGFTFWTGKNSFPFYTHDDLFVTQDISPEGIYGSYEHKLGSAITLKPAAAFFIINSNGKGFNQDRTIKAFQLHAKLKPGANELNLSTSLFIIDSVGNTPDGTSTFPVNYHESFTCLKYTYGKSKIPVSIAGNLIFNISKLDNSSITSSNLQGEKNGYSATIEIGRLKAAKDYLFSVTYAHIEKYSLLDYFAQDDWMRWGFSGGAGGTRGSNFKGFELRAAYAIGPNCNVVARTYFIEGIAPNKPDATIETNNRFRLDFNIGF